MNNNIQCSIESSTTKIELNSAVEGVFLVPELEGLVGLPEIRTTSGVNAGYDGGWTSAQNYDARLISIRGVIANPDISKVEDKRRAIASLLGQGRKEQLTLRFTTEAGNAYAISVRTISCEMALQRVLTTQEFLIQLRADDPLIYDDGTTGGIAAILQPQRALGGFEINFGLPLAIGGGAEDTVVDNGNETVYPVIKMYGALHSPTVVNRTTNQQMQILADLQYSIDWHTYHSATGDYILVNDGLDGAPMTLSQLLGNAEQTTYSGKNLFNINATPSEVLYATYTITDNAIRVVASSSPGTSRVTIPITLAPNTQYRVSFTSTVNTRGGTPLASFRLRVGSTSYGVVNLDGDTVGASVKHEVTFTTTSDTTGLGVWFYVRAQNNTAASDITFKDVQVELGNTTTAYEPYCGGIPSPNPDYPQDIQVLTGDSTVKITGKNLLSITQSSVINQGTYVSGANTNEYKIKATGNDIFVNAASTAGTFYTNTRGNLISCNYGETIYFNVGNNNFQKNYFTEWDENLVSLGYTLVSSSSGTYTPTKQGCKYVNFRFGNGYSVPDTTYTLSPIVCKTSNIAYEPYHGQSYEVNLGKNLLDINSLATTGITVSNGVATGQGQNFYASFGQNTDGVPFIKRSGQLTISFKAYTDGNVSTANTNGLVVRVVYTDGTSGLVVYCKNNETTAVQHTAITTFGKDVASIQLTYSNDGGNIWHISEFQIEKGGQATSYASYFTPIGLAEVGTYQDYIWNDDGTWKLHKGTAVAVLNGTEIWAESGSTHKRFVIGSAQTTFSLLAKGTPSYKSKCDHFTFQEGGTAWTGIGKCGFDGLGTFWCMISGMSSLADFKAWLGANNVRVYYPLATPTDTEITNETLLLQLNFLASLYKGENNISLVGTGTQGEMVIRYATDYTVNQDVITIDSQARTITLNGQDIYHLKTIESEFLVLAPGENKLYLTSEVSDDSGYAEVKFKQGYLSI